MTAYILKLLILIPLVAGLAWGSLWLWRRAQQGIGGAGRRERLVTLLDATPLGATAKLAVVEFEGKRLLIAVSRTGVQLINEAGAPAPLPTTTSRFGD
jgi:flagellar protein FliO/FliZ